MFSLRAGRRTFGDARHAAVLRATEAKRGRAAWLLTLALWPLIRLMTTYLIRPEGRIAYDRTGEGPLVVLVPGMGDLRSTYRFLVPVLVAAGFSVVSVDLRGHERQRRRVRVLWRRGDGRGPRCPP